MAKITELTAEQMKYLHVQLSLTFEKDRSISAKGTEAAVIKAFEFFTDTNWRTNEKNYNPLFMPELYEWGTTSYAINSAATTLGSIVPTDWFITIFIEGFFRNGFLPIGEGDDAEFEYWSETKKAIKALVRSGIHLLHGTIKQLAINEQDYILDGISMAVPGGSMHLLVRTEHYSGDLDDPEIAAVPLRLPGEETLGEYVSALAQNDALKAKIEEQDALIKKLQGLQPTLDARHNNSKRRL